MLEMLFWTFFVVYNVCVYCSFPCSFQTLGSLRYSNVKEENKFVLGNGWEGTLKPDLEIILDGAIYF